MRELLGRAEQLVDERFASDEALAVDLLVAIGDVYNALEETDNARRVMRRAYETSRRVADPSVQAGAACGWARTVALSGDFAGAQRLIDGALRVTTEEARFDDIVASCLADKGYIASTEGDPDATIAAGRKALDRLRRAPRAFSAIRANAMHVLALGYDGRGETANADRAYAQAMKEFERIGRDDTNDGATLLNNWAITRATTDTLGAFELQGRAIAVLETGESASVPAAFLANYGRLLNRLARYKEARSVYEEARKNARRHENVPTVGTASLGLARACRSLGDLGCAGEALRDAEPALRSSFPAGHYFLADLSHERGMLAAAKGDPESARRLLFEALDLHEKFAEKHASHIETLLELSRLELRSGRIDDAERHARRAREVAEGFRGGFPHSAWVGLSQVALAEVELAGGNGSEAHRLLEEAISEMRPTLGALHPAVVEAQRLLMSGAGALRGVSSRRSAPITPRSGKPDGGLYFVRCRAGIRPNCRVSSQANPQEGCSE
jgi:tetratricopeptide (TPR) repeat protein